MEDMINDENVLVDASEDMIKLNKELMDAIKEIEDIESGKVSAKRYSNVQELFDDLDKDQY